MARKSALACDDILAMIFDHLAPAPSDADETTQISRRSCRKALASSARVCTTLSYHALNTLWRGLDSIHPLLKTLPSCKLVGDWQLTLSGAISDENWTRFQLYADRVRAIMGTMDPELLHRIHPSVWVFLAGRCKGSPLMPRLRSFFALDVRLSEASGLALLTSPSLRTLDIFFVLELEEGEDSEIAPYVAGTLLQTLPLMAPNLEGLSCNIDIVLDPEYVHSFAQLTRLKSLSISSKLPLDQYALEMLSEICTLRDLSCSIDLSSSLALTSDASTFQGLTSFDVQGSFDDLTAFIDTCQLANLVAIKLRITQSPRAGKPADSFAAVCRRCDPTSLTSFSANIIYDDGPGSLQRPYCLMQYFEPLLTLPNVRFFYVAFYRRMVLRIHDDDLARFGAAWPRLSSFHVSYWNLQDNMSRYTVLPTLSGLVDLARRCPHLVTFRVPELNANVIPEKNATLPHGLRKFSSSSAVLPSPGSPPYVEAATLLARVFPSIDLKDAQSMARSSAKEWREFLELVETMRG